MIVYVVFFLPGGGPTPPTPDTLADFNTINRTLIEGKGYLRQLWDILYQGKGLNPVSMEPIKPVIPNSPEGIFRSLSAGCGSESSVGSNTPTASTSSLTSGFNSLEKAKSTIKVDPNISPLTSEKIVGTELHLPTIDHLLNSAMHRFFGSTDIGTQTNIISGRDEPLSYKVSDKELGYINNKTIEPSVNKNTPN